MATPAMNPQASGAPQGQPQGAPQGQGAVGSSGDPNQAKQAIQDFRDLAQKVQELAGKYPEFTEAAAAFLPQLQKSMAKVAGNPQRNPDRQPPPVGA